MQTFYLNHARLKPSCLMVPLLALALCSCTVGPDFKAPETSSPASFSEWSSGAYAENDVSQRAHNPYRRHDYNDATLHTLADMALKANADLKSAALNYAKALTQAGYVRAGEVPEVKLQGGISRNRMSEYSTSTRIMNALVSDNSQLLDIIGHPYNWYQAGLNFSWELDFWGHVRRAVEAEEASAEAQYNLLNDARLCVIAETVDAYYALRESQEQLRLACEDIDALSETHALFKAKCSGGATYEIDLKRQQSALAAARAREKELNLSASVNLNRLLFLLNERPGALTDVIGTAGKAPDPAQLHDLAAGLPSDLACRRPDIKAAGSRLHEATARIGVAEAELYPRITLSGSFGLDSYRSGDFADWASRTWSIGPSLDLPIFDYGRRKAVVQLRELEEQQAAVNFQQTVLRAWQEVDDAIGRVITAQNRYVDLKAQRASAKKAYDLILARYRGGMTDFINVLQSERSHIEARSAAAAGQFSALRAYAALNRALGNYPEQN